MYEKKIDGVMTATDVFGMLPSRKKRISVSGAMSVFTRYLLYALGVVLTVSLVVLALRLTVLSPVANHKGISTADSGKGMPVESVMGATAAILPETSVYYHGVRLGVYEGEANVDDILAYFNISLSEKDVVSHTEDESVNMAMVLAVDEISYNESIVDSVIPYEVVEIQCQTIPKGTRQIQVKGVEGSAQEVISTKYVNGEATEEQSAFNRYIAPINEEVLVGTGGVFTAPDGTEYNYSYYIDVTATAYTHTGDPTYMGTVAEVGVIAVDPRNIALGSNVYVIGNYGDYGVCRAEDIGGGIKGKRIDVFLDTEEECVIFGRRKMRAYVLE